MEKCIEDGCLLSRIREGNGWIVESGTAITMSFLVLLYFLEYVPILIN